MTYKNRLGTALLTLLVFLIPIEHKNFKTLHRFSNWLMPDDIHPWNYEWRIALYASDFIILALLYIYRVPLRRFFAHPIWLVFLFAFLSITVSPYSHYPIPYIHLLSLFTPMALFMLFRHGQFPSLRPVLLALLAAGVLQSCIAITQYFCQTPLGLNIFGEPKNIHGSLPMQANAIWILDPLFGIVREGVQMMRAGGTLVHPNALGGFILLPIAATLALGNKFYRFLPLFVFTLFITYSRSALCAFLLLLFVFLFIQRKNALKAVGIALVSSLLCTALFFPQLRQRSTLAHEVSNSTRAYYQNFSYKLISANPYLGLGYTQYLERSRDFLPKGSPQEYTAPHNIFLLLACESGIFAMIAMLLSGILLLLKALRTSMTQNHAAFFSLFLAMCFIGCCDVYLLWYQEGRLMLFLSASLLAATSYAAISTQETSRKLPSFK